MCKGYTSTPFLNGGRYLESVKSICVIRNRYQLPNWSLNISRNRYIRLESYDLGVAEWCNWNSPREDRSTIDSGLGLSFGLAVV